MTSHDTPIRELKTQGVYFLDNEVKPEVAIRSLFDSKGYDIEALREIDSADLSTVFSRLFMRRFNSPEDRIAMIEALQIDKLNRLNQEYVGDRNQNYEIDDAFSATRHNQRRLGDDERETYRGKVAGNGAAITFPEFPRARNRLYENLVDRIKDTPIAVIGGGISGLMITRALYEYGWNPSAITVFDRRTVTGGIWNYDHVAGLTRNNPKTLRFLGLPLPKAPGTGEEVADFAYQLDSGGRRFKLPILNIKMRNVIEITPGDLDTEITFKNRGGQIEKESYPIVVNAMGIGLPKPANNPAKMATNFKGTAPRWQSYITEKKAREMSGTTQVFIGLGNSTAENVEQIRGYNRRGFNIDYKIITHYPKFAVLDPTAMFVSQEGAYKVFRDLSEPVLVDWAGDLRPLERVYYESLDEGRIIPEVCQWEMEGSKMRLKFKDGSEDAIKCDKPHILIGYKHHKETYNKLGIITDDRGDPHYDFDGEIQAIVGAPGRKRIHPGYFGFGPTIESELNPNGVVIPGNNHRIGDLMFGITARAIEYNHRKN